MSPKKLAIVTTSRTGSNMLVFMLNSHPDILCHFELFHKEHIFHNFDESMMEDASRLQGEEWLDLKNRDADPVKFLDEVMSLPFGKEVVGMKIFNSHNRAILDQIIEDEDFYKIVLFRHNQFFRYTSEVAARETGIYSVLKKYSYYDKLTERRKIHFNFTEYEKMTKVVEGFFNDLKSKLRGKVFYCEYTQIKEPWCEKALVKFLDIQDIPELRKDDQVRQNSSSLEERVENWDELVNYAKDKGLEEWLTEKPYPVSELGEVKN